jgi:hypothetical protein
MMSGNRQLTLALLFVNQNDQPDEHHDDGDVVAVAVAVAGVEDGVVDGVEMAWRTALPVTWRE